MNCLLCTAILICFVAIDAVTAQDDTAILNRAADAYTTKDYDTAIELYERLLTEGVEAFELYYNLGNAYFKNDQIGAAILNYERAARIDPTDEDLLYNLTMARERTVDKIDMLSVPELLTGFRAFVNRFPADKWGMWSIFAFFLALLSAAVFLFFARRIVKQMALGFGVVFLVASIIFFYFGWQQQLWLNSRKEAIIFQPSITVHSTPGTTGEELFVLHEGTKVRIVERFQEWVRIRIGDGNSGWAPSDALEEI